MEPKRTLHSGNLVRGVHAEDRKLFILLRDGVHKIDKKNELENSVGRLIRSRGAFQMQKLLLKPIVADFKDRGQRRKLQLYGDNGERES